MSYNVQIVADSISPQNHRITSLLVTMPRFILAEFNTHRMLSRNSASSRAIPLHKMLESVKTNPFIPLRWMKEHTGMQGTEYFNERETFASTNPMDPIAPGKEGIFQRVEDNRWVGPGEALDIIPALKEKWLWLRDLAVQEAQALNNSGVLYHPGGDTSKLTGDGHGLTKQMCNRLLEPFMWHTVLCTATEWENFFALRAHPAAEIHMQHVAELMLEAMNSSKPEALRSGMWHIPFFKEIKAMRWDILKYLNITEGKGGSANQALVETMLKISTMMSARTSYTVPGGELSEWTVEKYVQKHDEMVKSGHWSPFEHAAQCMSESEYAVSEFKWIKDPQNPEDDIKQMGWCGNFRGWIQYRKTFANENQSDNRLIKHVWK